MVLARGLLTSGGSFAASRAFVRPLKSVPRISARLQSSIPHPVPADYTPVVSYQDGEREVNAIPRHDPIVVASQGQDSSRPAQAPKQEILDMLTPTLKKFTLTGKTAVVTGSVLAVIRVRSLNMIS